MKTVDKAMRVLDQFSLDRTEIGLTELSRLAGLDKAATRRLLVALGEHGYIEQRSDNKKYRLGYGFLRLARIREATVPLATTAQEALDWLFLQIDETVHANVPMNNSMTTIAYRVPSRSNIINITPAEPLPFHATASGLCYLALAGPDVVARVLPAKRAKVTAATITSKAELNKKLKQTREAGFARAHNSFEDGVAGLSMAFFLDGAEPSGTVSIVLPDNKLTDKRCLALLPLLQQTIDRIEKSMQG